MLDLDLDLQILQLIKEDASINEIASALNISHKKILYRLQNLRNKGYTFVKKYYSDGEVVFKMNNTLGIPKDVRLITKPNEKALNMLFISDLHFGNVNERIDLLKRVYEICAKENINIIINAGDLVDGYLGTSSDKKFLSSEDQINHVIKKYPFDKNIINFICFGDHDYSVFETTGQNIENVLERYRYDLVPLGYKNGKLKIKNDDILVSHYIKGINYNEPPRNGLTVLGHSHISKYNYGGKNANITIPALSSVISNRLPGFLKAKVFFNKGIINFLELEEYIYFDKFYLVNTSAIEVASNKKNKSFKIENEEIRTPYCKKK